jgi:hypothetical protein
LEPKLSELKAREVYQILKDVALGLRTMRRVSDQSCADLHSGVITVEIDGWEMTFFVDCYDFDYCEQCTSPDGRVGSYETWHRFGTNPAHLLSNWEHQQLKGLVRDL